MSNASESRVPLSKDTRYRLKNAKRAGETYDSLFQKMLNQYDPDEAHDASEAKA
jgi:hypothetical protein